MGDEWDPCDIPMCTTTAQKPASFGSLQPQKGFGASNPVRGLGRGKDVGGVSSFGISDSNNNATSSSGGFGSGFGGSSSSGFGGSGSSGFGGSGSGSAGFGSSSGGFGSGSNDAGGFGGSRGFGRGGGGGGSSSGCFKCGEEGHMSRDCPKSGGGGGGGGGGGRGCFKCGEEGHMSRECPSGGGGGGGRGSGRGCFKCGEEGHMSRDCPNPGSSNGVGRGGGGGGGGSGRGCFKCGEEGHMSRDCPSQGGSGGGGAGRSGGKGCFKCGEEGHMSRDCPSGGGGGGAGGSRGKGCFKCGEEGHMSRDCPTGGQSGSSGFGGSSGGGGFGGSSGGGFGGSSGGGFGGASTGGGFGGSSDEPRGGGFGNGDSGSGGPKKSGCFKCGQEGHMSRDCTNEAVATVGPDGEKRAPPYIPPALPEDDETLFATIQKGINFDKYDNIPVECTGHDAPKRSLTSFTEATLHETVKENVIKAKYDKPTPIQKWAIPIIMGGRDMMACAQTGSGKTAAFLLPVLTGMLRNGVEGGQFSVVQEPQAIIVGPTRELVTQIYNEARKFAHNTMVRPVVVYGGVTTGYQAREVSKGAHLVVGTAGRLLDFIKKGYLSLAKVKYFILDEADRMLDMGFLPSMMSLANELGMPPKTERQTLMFSATFPEEVQQLAKELLNDYIFVTVGRVGGANTDIEQHVLQVDQFNKREKLVSILNSQGQQRTLVFVEQKRQADFIASYLSQSEFPTTSIHGDREQREREEALRDFKNGTAPILVATSVAARGLDIPGVNHVINFDMPASIDEYVHRIGRTGRCGNLGRATSFFNPSSDQPLARPLVKVLVDAQQEIPDWLEALAGESYGTGGFVGGATQFKDSRGGNFGGSSSNGPSSSFSAAAAPAAGAGGDEWD